MLKTAQNELNEVKSQLSVLKAIEVEYRTTSARVTSLEEQIEGLKKKLQQEVDEKMDLVNEKEKFEREKKTELEKISEENLNLKSELNKLNELIAVKEKGAEGKLFRS